MAVLAKPFDMESTLLHNPNRSTATTSPHNFPRWCVSRGGGVYVPLVALDELPEDIKLQHVPRNMSLMQTSGMQYLGEYRACDHKYSLAPEQARLKQQDGVVEDGKNEQVTPLVRNLQQLRDVGSQQKDFSAVLLRKQHIHDKAVEPCQTDRSGHASAFLQLSKHSTVTSSPFNRGGVGPTRRPNPPSGREPDMSKKYYCTHWIRTGECDFMQQGCMYKHIMPSSLATLHEICGIQKWPTWWTEQQKRARKAPVVPKMDLERGNRSDASSTSAQSTDTGSLHLGNPDSQRFLRKDLPKLQVDIEEIDAAAAPPPSPASPTVCERLEKMIYYPTTSLEDDRRTSTLTERELRLIDLHAPALVPQPPPEENVRGPKDIRERLENRPAPEERSDLFSPTLSMIHPRRFVSAARGLSGRPETEAAGKNAEIATCSAPAAHSEGLKNWTDKVVKGPATVLSKCGADRETKSRRRETKGVTPAPAKSTGSGKRTHPGHPKAEGTHGKRAGAKGAQRPCGTARVTYASSSSTD